ncbi:MAG: PRC-barrel domain-containing protein [Candidatus Dormiibacterota bacterium]
MSGPEQPSHRSPEDLHFGARVYSSDGQHIGSLTFMIVDGESFDVRAIVVKETRAFSGHRLAGAAMMEDDIAIPVASVGDVDRERITLSVTSSAARRTEPYLTYHYAPIARGDIGRMLIAESSETGDPPHVIEEAHKRLDELEIGQGENVMLGHTGRRLGTVRDVILDGGQLIGVVVHPAGFFKEDVLLQTRFLGRSDDLALFAHLTDGDLAHLTPFHPAQS